MRAAGLIGLLAVVAPAGPVAAAAPDAVAVRFDAMKRLVGSWTRADRPDGPLRVRFSLTAGDTVLVESWERAGQPHSLTLYHRDGGTIVATHYCPQGNQPRLAMLPDGGVGVIRFAFRDATDLDAAHESYLVALSFDLSDPATLVRRETYRQGTADEASELRLVRVRPG